MSNTLTEQDYLDLENAINTVVNLTHKAATLGGWWEGYDWSDIHRQNTKIGLIGSEIFEAQDALRTDSNDNHLPQYKGVYTEIGDAVIRSGDTIGRYMEDDPTLNFGRIVTDKMRYNANRADHKSENRAKAGGKKF